MIRTALILFRKDALVEVRTLQSLTAMALFSVMAFVLFHFGLQRDTIAASSFDQASRVAFAASRSFSPAARLTPRMRGAVRYASL